MTEGEGKAYSVLSDGGQEGGKAGQVYDRRHAGMSFGPVARRDL